MKESTGSAGGAGIGGAIAFSIGASMMRRVKLAALEADLRLMFGRIPIDCMTGGLGSEKSAF
jgi:hypothetical protein